MGEQGILNTAGPGAARIAELWWVYFWPGLAVFLAVVALLLVGLYRRHRRPMDERHEASGKLWIGVGGIAIPALILLVVLAFTLRAMAQHSASSREAEARGLAIRVTGYQWWWDVEYQTPEPSRRVRTANEIHVPVGQPVRLLFESGDVNHSFWIPQLQGKMDLIPGQTNTIWLQADEPGEYRGQCAEYCGEQHAHMGLLVLAQEPEQFEAWYERQLAAAAEPADSLARAGQEVFLRAGCALCHAVRGTGALARTGPDLTHLAGRRTLAAGTVPNNRGYLGGWIANPQAIKPGNRMPAFPLEGPELQALLSYLESLR